jgi:MFS family permease
VLVIFLFVPDLPPSQIVAHCKGEEHEKDALYKALFKRPVLLIYSVLALFSAFVYSQHSFSLPLILNNVLQEKGAGFFGIVMSINAVTVLLLTPMLTASLYKRKPLFNMAMGQIFYAVGFGMLYFAFQYHYIFIISTIIWTLGEILNAINSGVFLANHTPINYRGRFSAFFSTAQSVGHSLTPVISGMILENTGLRLIWILTFILGIILACSFLALVVWDRKELTTA